MKKIFGWIFIIAGIGNIIRTIGMSSESAIGSEQKIGELFLFGIGFMVLGVWMVNSSGKGDKLEATDDIDNEPIKVTKKFNPTQKINNESSSKKTVEPNNKAENNNDEKVNFFSFAGNFSTLAFIGIFLILMVLLWWHTSQ